MIIHLKSGKVFDPTNKIFNKEKDIFIKHGKIIDRSDLNEKIDRVINCKDKIISPGFLDLRSHFGDPGFEDKETLESGSKAALAGGFTKNADTSNIFLTRFINDTDKIEISLSNLNDYKNYKSD